jgi:hypothetical protein
MPHKANGALPSSGDLANSFKSGYAATVSGLNLSEVSFNPQRSHTLMLYALTMDIGDVVRINETVTGTTNQDGMIVRIEHEITPGAIIKTRWILAPQSGVTY